VVTAVTPKRSRPLNLDDFDAIDWDAEDDPGSNLAHCKFDHGVDEWVVDEVLGGDWIDVEMEVARAEFAIVGPNARRNFMWTLLFDVSWKRGDWLRPVTGWDSRPKEIRDWERVMGQEWKGSGQKQPRTRGRWRR
jgi:hypothetical protein